MGLLRILILLLELGCSHLSLLVRHGASGISMKIPRFLLNPSNLLRLEPQMFLKHRAALISAQVFILPDATCFCVFVGLAPRRIQGILGIPLEKSCWIPKLSEFASFFKKNCFSSSFQCFRQLFYSSCFNNCLLLLLAE